MQTPACGGAYRACVPTLRGASSARRGARRPGGGVPPFRRPSPSNGRRHSRAPVGAVRGERVRRCGPRFRHGRTEIRGAVLTRVNQSRSPPRERVSARASFGESEQQEGQPQLAVFKSLLCTDGTHFGPPQEKSNANERTRCAQISQATHRHAQGKTRRAGSQAAPPQAGTELPCARKNGSAGKTVSRK